MLYFPTWGAKRTWSTSSLILSTPLLEAASNSWMLNEWLSLKPLQESQVSHASIFSVRFMQLMVLASILAQEVLPTPLGPQNKKACAKWLFLMAFLRVFVMDCCPTTVSKVEGRYLRADTTKFSINNFCENKYNIMIGISIFNHALCQIIT